MNCRELDAWIAEHVMECPGHLEWWAMDRKEEGIYISFTRKGEADEWLVEMVTRFPKGLHAEQGCHIVERRIYPRYTASSIDAMDVLKKCTEECDQVSIVECEGTWAMCAGDGNHVEPVVEGEAPTLELAICLFAKKLFGGAA